MVTSTDPSGYIRRTSGYLEAAEAAVQAMHHRFTDQPPHYVKSFAYALRDALSSTRDMLGMENLLHSVSEAQTWQQAVSAIENAEDSHQRTSLIGHVRESHVSRLRQLESHAKKPAFVWLVTQADLLFIAVEKSYVEVPIQKRLALITAIASRIETMADLRESELYALTDVLQWSELTDLWDATGAVLLDELMALGQMTVNEFEGVIDESWLMLVVCSDGPIRKRIRFLAGMSSDELAYFARFTVYARDKLAELMERAGVVVQEMFNDEFLEDAWESQREDEPLLTLERRIADMESRSDTMVQRFQMFARWEPHSIATARDMYMSQFRFGRWPDFNGLDRYLDALSRGVAVEDLSGEELEGVRDQWNWNDSSSDDDSDSEVEGDSLENFLAQVRSARLITAPPYAGEIMRLETLVQRIRITNPSLGQLIEGVSQLSVAPHHAVRLHRYFDDQGLWPETKLGLITAYGFSRIAGIKLLAIDESLAMQALGISSPALLVQYRMILSLLVHLSFDIGVYVLGKIEEYLRIAPQRADEIVQALKRLVAASKEYEVHDHAVHRFPGAHLLSSPVRLDELSRSVDDFISKRGQYLPEKLGECIRNLPLPDGVTDLIRSYLSTDMELLTREFSRLVRSEFWKSGTDHWWRMRSLLGNNLNAVLPSLYLPLPPVAREVFMLFIQYVRLAARRSAEVPNEVKSAAVRFFCVPGFHYSISLSDVAISCSLAPWEEIRATMITEIKKLG